jgi:hypothetical protein
MPHAEIAKLVAGSLHQLPHPKHGEIRLMGFSPFMLSQQPKDVQGQVNGHAQAIGEGVVHLIEQNGKTIIDTAELERLRSIAATQSAEYPKIAAGFCQHCGCELIRLTVDENMQAKLHRIAIEAITGPLSEHRCWDK